METNSVCTHVYNSPTLPGPRLRLWGYGLRGAFLAGLEILCPYRAPKRVSGRHRVCRPQCFGALRFSHPIPSGFGGTRADIGAAHSEVLSLASQIFFILPCTLLLTGWRNVLYYRICKLIPPHRVRRLGEKNDVIPCKVWWHL